MYEASIVEITLKHFIKLWEQRNEEVHGKTMKRIHILREHNDQCAM
jgi:hypothetical protein